MFVAPASANNSIVTFPSYAIFNQSNQVKVSAIDQYSNQCSCVICADNLIRGEVHWSGGELELAFECITPLWVASFLPVALEPVAIYVYINGARVPNAPAIIPVYSAPQCVPGFFNPESGEDVRCDVGCIVACVIPHACDDVVNLALVLDSRALLVRLEPSRMLQQQNRASRVGQVEPRLRVDLHRARHVFVMQVCSPSHSTDRLWASYPLIHSSTRWLAGSFVSKGFHGPTCQPCPRTALGEKEICEKNNTCKVSRTGDICTLCSKPGYLPLLGYCHGM